MDSRRLILFLALVAFDCRAQQAANYRLDVNGPVHVTELPPIPRPLPTRVAIYIAGPYRYINKSDTVSKLERHPPFLSITNRVKITNLMSVLQKNDNKARIRDVTKRQGFTYHLLLFQDENKTVMHFRVFETMESKTPWCMVDPVNDTGFCYFNNQIGPWLHSHAKIPTNGAPIISGTGTNAPNNKP